MTRFISKNYKSFKKIKGGMNRLSNSLRQKILNHVSSKAVQNGKTSRKIRQICRTFKNNYIINLKI